MTVDGAMRSMMMRCADDTMRTMMVECHDDTIRSIVRWMTIRIDDNTIDGTKRYDANNASEWYEAMVRCDR